MITIKPSYGRYYSNFQGQEQELKEVLAIVSPEYILEIKPNKAKPERVWWAIYNAEGLAKLQRVIGGKVVEDVETDEVAISADSVLDRICKKIGHNPVRCEVLGDNGVYTLIKLPQVQRPKEDYYKSPCVIKVSNADLEYTEVFDCKGTRLGRIVKDNLIKEHL